MILELKEPFDLVTPLGPAVAKFIESTADEIFWGCFVKETGECWWWRNPHIRLAPNISEGRYKTSEIEIPDDMRTRIVRGVVRANGKQSTTR